MKKLTVSLLSLMVAGLASTAGAVDCAALKRAYDIDTKDVSLVSTEGIGDNSAPRATLREMKLLNLNVQRQMNLTMMIKLNCPLPDSPAGTSDYIVDAMECNIEIAKGNYNSDKCIKQNWKPFGKGDESTAAK